MGGALTHLKIHGALANMASEDPEIAKVCYGALRDVAPELIVMVLVGTAQQRVAEALGLTWAGEIFADRAYNADATLVSRGTPGAVIHDPQTAAARVVEMVQRDAILTQDGQAIPVQIDTICMHGDTPTAIQIASEVRHSLEAAGITVAPLRSA